MTETLQDALREMADDGNRTRTHCEGCWQWHLPCAAMYAADVIDAAQRTIAALMQEIADLRG